MFLSSRPHTPSLPRLFLSLSLSLTKGVVAAYLMRSEGLSYADALAVMRRVRPRACPNLGFALQLRRFERSHESTEGTARALAGITAAQGVGAQGAGAQGSVSVRGAVVAER